MTEAGERLLEMLRTHAPWFVGGSEATELDAILAVEAEAAAAEHERIIRELGSLVTWTWNTSHTRLRKLVDKVAVLRIVRDER